MSNEEIEAESVWVGRCYDLDGNYEYFGYTNEELNELLGAEDE